MTNKHPWTRCAVFLCIFILLLADAAVAAPRIIGFGPQIRYVGLHRNYSFRVTAVGNHLHYQWWHQEPDSADGHPIPVEEGFYSNTPWLRVTLAQATRDYNGWYWCVVTDGVTGQSVMSPRGQVFVIDVPAIVTQPQDQTVAVGMPVSFKVEVDAHGPVPIRYQWYFNGRPLFGANHPTLNLPFARPARQGEYSCRVRTMGGTNFSSGAILTVTPAN
jgi:hypothetical protein